MVSDASAIAGVLGILCWLLMPSIQTWWVKPPFDDQSASSRFDIAARSHIIKPSNHIRLLRTEYRQATPKRVARRAQGKSPHERIFPSKSNLAFSRARNRIAAHNPAAEGLKSVLRYEKGTCEGAFSLLTGIPPSDHESLVRILARRPDAGPLHYLHQILQTGQMSSTHIIQALQPT